MAKRVELFSNPKEIQSNHKTNQPDNKQKSSKLKYQPPKQIKQVAKQTIKAQHLISLIKINSTLIPTFHNQLKQLSTGYSIQLHLNSKAVIIKRNHIKSFKYNYNEQASCLLSLTMIKQFLKQKDGSLAYGSDLDIVKYIKGKRATINPSSDFNYNLTMDLFRNCQCSLRILRPHQMSDNLTKLIALFQELFSSGGGANAYITPSAKKSADQTIQEQQSSQDENQNKPKQAKKSQGFAPHYDDVDTFIFQLEGSKHWKLHKSPSQSQMLAINPSNDFNPKTNLPQLVWEGVLQEGDLLYMPRGVIHHAHTIGDKHSLHVTISNQHHNTYGEFINEGIRKIIEDQFIHSSTTKKFRKSLPNMSEFSPSQNKFQNLVNEIKSAITPQMVYKCGIDSKAREFQFNRQNPVELISTEVDDEKEDDSDDDGDEDEKQNQPISEKNSIKENENSRIKLVSLHCASIGNKNLYYSTFNSRGYQEVDSQKIILDQQWKIQIMRQLKKKYPKYVDIKDIVQQDNINKANDFIDQLADQHIIVIQ